MPMVLADNSFVSDLFHELQNDIDGPATRFLTRHQVALNAVAVAEFMACEPTEGRVRCLRHFAKLACLGFSTGMLAGRVKFARQRYVRLHKIRGKKELSLCDAMMAADAIIRGMPLVCADKDFSGIPGLKAMPYRQPRTP